MAKRRYGTKSEVTMEYNQRPKNTDMAQNSMSMSKNGVVTRVNSEGRPNSAGTKAMVTNDRRGAFIQEDWNEPALLKRGVHEFDITYRANKHRSGRLGDLYEEVEKTTREDQAAFDKLTDPHNW